MEAVPWVAAWQAALYGPGGFYRQESSARHFTSAAHGRSGAVLAEVLWRWADRLGATGVLDLGARCGELLECLRQARPDRLLVGCDIVPRPSQLASSVAWIRSPGGAQLPEELHDLSDVLVVAHEWLDAVPCQLAAVDEDGRRQVVLVDPRTGQEVLGGPLEKADDLWCERHWPATVPGQRVEVGRYRDRAWADLLSRVTAGAALAVDYGHVAGGRPPHGTFTAYRLGERVIPVPDGSCDLTADVAVDSLEHTQLLSQTSAFAAVGMRPEAPAPGLAAENPVGYLDHLDWAATVAELTRAAGPGGRWWIVGRR